MGVCSWQPVTVPGAKRFHRNPSLQEIMGNSQSMCSNCENDSGSSHSECESPSWCTCDCNVGGAHDVAQKTAAIGGGAASIVGGILLTIFTGGWGGFVAAGVALGVGVSSATNGITAAAKKEKMNAASYGIDTLFGAAGGGLTGGAGGTAAKIGATTGVKVAVGAGLGAVAGTAAGAVGEGGNLWQKRIAGNDESEYSGHGIWAGAVAGGLGGAASGAVNSMANKAANTVTIVKRGVAKGVTRAGTEIWSQASGIALDHGAQDIAS